MARKTNDTTYVLIKLSTLNKMMTDYPELPLVLSKKNIRAIEEVLNIKFDEEELRLTTAKEVNAECFQRPTTALKFEVS